MEFLGAYVGASALHGLYRAHNAMESFEGSVEVVQATPVEVNPFMFYDLSDDYSESQHNTTLLKSSDNKFEVFSKTVVPVGLHQFSDEKRIKGYEAQKKIGNGYGLLRIHPSDCRLKVKTFTHSGVLWTDNKFVISPNRTRAYMYSAFHRRAPLTLTVASVGMFVLATLFKRHVEKKLSPM